MTSVLVIGAGTMGKTHIREYEKMEQVHLAGIVDLHTQEWRKKNGRSIPCFATLEEAVDSGIEFDVVDICLPTYLHREYVVKAANMGKHIICEKPIAHTLEDAEKMMEACRMNGVRLFIAHVVRFFPEYELAKGKIDSGAIGTPGVIRMSRNSRFPKAWEDWYANEEKSGGLLLDLLIHDFDYLRWCFGDAERVYAVGSKGEKGTTYALITIAFRSGVLAHVEGSWVHERFYTQFEMAGSGGIIQFSSLDSVPVTGFLHEESGVAVPERLMKQNAYHRELSHFIACIAEDKDPVVTADDAFEAVSIALAAAESLKTGKAVSPCSIKRKAAAPEFH